MGPTATAEMSRLPRPQSAHLAGTARRFPGQPRDEVPLVCPVSSLGLLPVGEAPNTSPGRRAGGIRNRCLSHLSWSLSMLRNRGIFWSRFICAVTPFCFLFCFKLSYLCGVFFNVYLLLLCFICCVKETYCCHPRKKRTQNHVITWNCHLYRPLMSRLHEWWLLSRCFAIFSSYGVILSQNNTTVSSSNIKIK